MFCFAGRGYQIRIEDDRGSMDVRSYTTASSNFWSEFLGKFAGEFAGELMGGTIWKVDARAKLWIDGSITNGLGAIRVRHHFIK